MKAIRTLGKYSVVGLTGLTAYHLLPRERKERFEADLCRYKDKLEAQVKAHGEDVVEYAGTTGCQMLKKMEAIAKEEGFKTDRLQPVLDRCEARNKEIQRKKPR